ncbi:nucleotide-binding universal stress UspA family protein [Deinococcus budaensis]|uniref:Nucleotide-binding universal stress UspA family protein n=1 Tax=Deinococcus budaensis TaxID=1665626 RepID=A0A7W8GGB6_9DEIO|nr:universal stress protein [Deinococcus budaensis]MBB5234698.1 nucleotide-binding universal stress UspA family protein [Deinococcus budaensis]
MFRHLLVPVDHHPACHPAAHHAYDLTRALGGRVTLLHILERDTPPERTSADRHLETLAAGARRPPARVVLPVRDHDVQGAIAHYARKHAADLIVLGISGAGGLTDDALGKFAVNLARLSALPVHLTGSRPPSEAVPSRWVQVLGDRHRAAHPGVDGARSEP